MEPTPQPLDLRDLAWRARRYRWLLALPPVLALCAATIYLTLRKPIYESHVIVSLGNQAQVSPALENLVRADRDRDTPRERMTLVDSKIRSRPFLEELVNRLGMLSSPGLLKAASEAAQRFHGISREEFAVRIACTTIAKQIRVTPEDAMFVRITCSGPDPEAARSLASKITEVLIQESRRSGLERVQARSEFSTDQISVQQERLREAEDRYQRFQESMARRGLTSNPVRERNVDQARGLIRATDLEIEQVRSRIEAQRDQGRAVPGTDEAPLDLSTARAQSLERRLTDLELSVGVATLRGGEETTGDVAAIQGNIGTLRQELLAEFEATASARSGEYSDAARETAAGIALDRSVIRTLRAKRDRLSRWVTDFGRGVENSPREEMELTRLKSEVESNRELLNTLRREATSSRISEALETSELGPRLAVIDAPQLPLRAASPDPFKVFGGALLLGPLLSLGIVLTGERITAVIRTAEEAEREIGAKVVGTVPLIEGWSRPGSFLHNHWAELSIVLVLLLTGIFHTLNATILAERPGQGHSESQSRFAAPR